MDLVQAFREALTVAVSPQGAAFAVAAIGLNIHFGYTGLLNFGHVAFFLVGAYGTAIVVDAGGSMWLGLLAGIGAAVVLALLLGLPTLRLRADYLAIVTIAIAEIARLVVGSNWAGPVTGGGKGIGSVAVEFRDANPIPDGIYEFLGLRFSGRLLWVMLVGWAIALLGSLLVWALVRSPWGRLLRSIREDEDAARSLGKNVFAVKLQSLVLGGVFGALAGIVLMFNSISVSPAPYEAEKTFFVYVIVILGGAGTVLGPVIGSLIFWFLIQFSESLLSQAINTGAIDFLTSQQVASVRFMLVGLGLILLMVFRPQGIFGDPDEIALHDS